MFMKPLNMDIQNGNTMSKETASHIAKCLTNSNNLSDPVSADVLVRNGPDTMVFMNNISQDVGFSGTVTVKRRQWYQSELKYLYVPKELRGRGLGSSLIDVAQVYALFGKKTPILQCTTRESNIPVVKLLVIKEFTCVHVFKSPKSGERILVWQKNLAREQ